MIRGSWHDVMQVCINGHKITEYAESQPESRQSFCADCGEKTIDACPKCGESIQGHHHMEDVYDFTDDYPVPKHCIHCGAAYPWQVAAIENLKEIFQESELSLQDREELDKALPDIMRDTPKTESASLKVKRIMAKLRKPLYDVAIKVVTDVASETTKKTLGLG